MSPFSKPILTPPACVLLSHPLMYSAEVNPSFLRVYMMFILLNSLSIGDVCLSLPLYLHVKYINNNSYMCMFTTLSSQTLNQYIRIIPLSFSSLVLTIVPFHW